MDAIQKIAAIAGLEDQRKELSEKLAVINLRISELRAVQPERRECFGCDNFRQWWMKDKSGNRYCDKYKGAIPADYNGKDCPSWAEIKIPF